MASGRNRIEIEISAKDKASRKIKDVQKSTTKLGKAMGGLKKFAGPAAIAATAVTAIGVSAVNSGRKFERSFAQVATLLDDVTKDELKVMHDQLIAVSDEMAVDLNDSVGALYQAISGGIPANSWLRFMQTAMKLSRAGAAELTPVVGVLAGIMKNYGLEVSETERVSDLLLNTVKLGVTTMDELGASLGDLLPSAKASGLSLEETLGTLAALTQTSGKTTKSVTQFRALLVELMRPTTKLAQAVKEKLGKSFSDLIKEGGTTAGVLQNLRNVMPDEEFKAAFGSAEGLNAALGITGELHGGVVASMEAMTEAAGSLTAAFEIAIEAPGAALDDAVVRFNNAKIRLGIAMADPLEKVLNKIAQIFEELHGEETWDEVARSKAKGFFQMVNKWEWDYRGQSGPQAGADLIKDTVRGLGMGLTDVQKFQMGGEAPVGLQRWLTKDAPAIEAQLSDVGLGKMRDLFVGGGVKRRQAAGAMEAALRGRGTGISDLGLAIEAETIRVKEATASMLPFGNDLISLSESSKIANEMFGMTAEKTAALAAIEEEASTTLAELTAALEAGTISFEDVEKSWATQIADAADAIENIRLDEESKVVDALEEAAQKQAEEAARQLAVSKVQISMMGKSLEEIAASGNLVGMTRSEINTLFQASQMNNAGAGIAGEGFMQDADWRLAQQNMVKIRGGNLGLGGSGVSSLLGAVARTGVHEMAPGVFYSVTIEGNVFASDDSGRAIVEAIDAYAVSQGQTSAEVLNAEPISH